MKSLITLLLSFASTLLFAQKHYERLASIDIQHYMFELQLNDQNDRINGIAHVTVRLLKDLDQFTLDLINESGGKGMKVNAVMSDSQPVKFSHQNDQLVINTSAKSGELKTFLIAYEGIPQTGLIISKNKNKFKIFLLVIKKE